MNRQEEIENLRVVIVNNLKVELEEAYTSKSRELIIEAAKELILYEEEINNLK